MVLKDDLQFYQVYYEFNNFTKFQTLDRQSKEWCKVFLVLENFVSRIINIELGPINFKITCNFLIFSCCS